MVGLIFDYVGYEGIIEFILVYQKWNGTDFSFYLVPDEYIVPEG